MKAIRVDPAMLYNLGGTPDTLASNLINDAQTVGADTIIVYAINPEYGAFYNTDYMPVENGLGKADFLPQLLAQAAGINIIVSPPTTGFQWLAVNAGWRAQTSNGLPYQAYQMSCSSPDFSNWLGGMIDDLFAKCPAIAGVELREPQVASDWSPIPDLNPSAIAAFQAQNPGQPTSGPLWLQFRASALTALIGMVGAKVNAQNKTFGVVQDTGGAGCALTPFATYRDEVGFDYDGIMNLPAGQLPTYVAAELIWQQALAERNCPTADPSWVGPAAAEFVKRVAGRTQPCIHVEMTGFPLGSPAITGAQLTASILAALANAPSVSVFEYTMIKQAGALGAVTAGFGA